MKFDWELDDDAEANFQQREPEGKDPKKRSWRFAWIGLVLAILVAGASWWRVTQFDRETERFLQAAVDLQISAISNRDGDLYFTNYTGTPANTYTQMHPKQIEFWMSNPEIVDFELFEKEIWAQAEWTSPDNERLYRTLFFSDRNASVRLHIGSATYWQSYYEADLSHGSLILSERDRPFEREFQGRLNPTLEAYCAKAAAR